MRGDYGGGCKEEEGGVSGDGEGVDKNFMEYFVFFFPFKLWIFSFVEFWWDVYGTNLCYLVLNTRNHKIRKVQPRKIIIF